MGENHLLPENTIPRIRGGLSPLFTRPARSKILTISYCASNDEWLMLLTQRHAQTPYYYGRTLTQGCRVWLQSRSNWPQSGKIPKLFKITCQYILALDLFHLGSIGPTLEPTLTSLSDTRNRHYVCVNWFIEYQ